MHRRAGKTVACINELLTRALATYKDRAQYAYIAPYRNQAKKVAWEYLKYYGRDIIGTVNESELYVELTYNKARISLYGADNADSIRGIYLDGIVLDEYADMKPSVWGSIIRPLLTDRIGWAVFIGTPKGHNAFYDIYKRAISDRNWHSMLLPASRSLILSDKELEEARKDMTEDQYEQEFECSFEAAIMGAVYGKWMRIAAEDGRIVGGLYDPALKVHTAWDLGFGDKTAIWFWQSAMNEIRLIDYHENSGYGIDHYLNNVLNLKRQTLGYNYGAHYGPHDLMNKIMAARGRSLFEQAKDLGYTFTVVLATSQTNQISAARKALEVCYFDPESCMDGIERLRQYRFKWDEDKKVFSDAPYHDQHSHGADAFEIIGQVWKNPVENRNKVSGKYLSDVDYIKSGVAHMRPLRPKNNHYERI